MSNPCWQVFCDGSALPRGTIAIGVVIVSPDGARHTLSEISPRRGCSNAAEALAFISALEEALRLGARALQLACDSSITIAEASGARRTKVERLAPLYAEIRALLLRFEHVSMRWIPRHKNSEADALSRRALGLCAKPHVPNNKRQKK